MHLSHGQLMCRRQARETSEALATATAVVAGDFNTTDDSEAAVLREFADVGVGG